MQSEFEKTFKQHIDALTTELSKLGKQRQVQVAEWDIEQNKADYEFYFTAGWQAAKAQAVPEGFVLVPKKATKKMLNAGYEAHDGFFSNGAVQDVYVAMIEAQESPMTEIQQSKQAEIDDLKAQLKAVHDSRVEFVEYCRVVEAQENKG